jgi:hypothetical protein
LEASTDQIGTRGGWATVLADRFFPVVASPRPASLSVDDDVLDELAGMGPDEGARSLLREVRPGLRWRDQARLFDDIAQAGYAWSGSVGPPPFLPLLALCVLAAARMGPDEDVSAANYYRRLQAVLDLQSSPAQAFRECVPSMFRLLSEWLDRVHRGRRGTSTIPDSPFPAHVGFPISQALFRQSDRRKLVSFFASRGLIPGDVDAVPLLMPAFVRWAETAGLSKGALRLVRDAGARSRLLQLVTAELASWDRSERDETGRKILTARLLLRVHGGSSWSLLVPRPGGLSATLDVEATTGAAFSLRAAGDDFYAPMLLDASGGPALAEALLPGFLLRSKTITIRAGVGRVIPLGETEDVGGHLASRRRVVPGEAHWLLVRDDMKAPALALLVEIAREGWYEAPVEAPAGWVLLRDVVIDLPPPGEVHPDLAPLVPAVEGRPQLRGGLPVDTGEGRAYLTGGAPDLWLPEWITVGGDISILADGRPDPLLRPAERVPLSVLSLDPGAHAVEVGGLRLPFRMVAQNVRDIAEASYSEVGISLAVASTGPARQVEGDWLAGATVTAAGWLAEDLYPRPILLRRGALAYVVLGPTPGQVEASPEPPREQWLERVGVEPTDFEVFPSFPVAWVLTKWVTGWEAQAASPSPPTAPAGASGSAATWARALLVPFVYCSDPAAMAGYVVVAAEIDA